MQRSIAVQDPLDEEAGSFNYGRSHPCGKRRGLESINDNSSPASLLRESLGSVHVETWIIHGGGKGYSYHATKVLGRSTTQEQREIHVLYRWMSGQMKINCFPVVECHMLVVSVRYHKILVLKAIKREADRALVERFQEETLVNCEPWKDVAQQVHVFLTVVS